MALFFLRHVRTVSNQSRVISGRREFEILSNQSLNIPENCSYFTQIFCSSSRRCIETLDLLPEQYMKCKIMLTDKLLERCLGVLEGISKVDAMREHSEYFVNGRISVYATIEGAESVQDVVKRVYGLTQVFEENSKKENILVCSHNQTLKIIYALLNNLEISDTYWNAMDFRNGEIVEIKM